MVRKMKENKKSFADGNNNNKPDVEKWKEKFIQEQYQVCIRKGPNCPLLVNTGIAKNLAYTVECAVITSSLFLKQNLILAQDGLISGLPPRRRI